MRIQFIKTSDRSHVLRLCRASFPSEEETYDTRNILMHDLLHYALESEANLREGFWGLLAQGKTLADMSDRTGRSLAGAGPTLLAIEQVVGPLSRLAKGARPGDVLQGYMSYATATSMRVPDWLTEPLLERVHAQMRHLSGRWKATPYRGIMELVWSVPAEPH